MSATAAVSDARVLAWLRLARIATIGPVLVHRAVAALGSPEAVLGADPARLSAIEDIGPKRANAFMLAPALDAVHKEFEETRAAGVSFLTPDDPLWPPGLRTIHDPPILLFLRGSLRREDALAIGIVGSRQCTLYGRQQAERFGAQLATANLTIVSGGARGIDTAAHEGALKAKGRTLVIQGCGLGNSRI